MTQMNPSRTRTAGFTLVELMVALVVGLLVVLAAVSFLVSVARANSQDIQVTRLTQELRALSEVMSREIRRARYVADPIGLVAQGSAALSNDSISISSDGTCIVFEYDEPPDPPSPGGLAARSIRLEDGRVFLNTTGSTCSGGRAISSPEIRITSLQFQQFGTFRIDQTAVGELTTTPPGLEGLSRTFRQTIYVRSGEVD